MLIILQITYVENCLRKAINFNAAAQPDYLGLPYRACNQS